ncbi:MAG: type II toxin-antitoxin system VapC family toxin [Gammaproteobacteria bacterium]|nr:type II toxin-antitoxin system VapC family toxin [Gammaproteobacteria bacterium]
MIVLDTNVVSEPMKPNGDPTVQAWLDRQIAETLFLTTVNLAELLLGLEFLPTGRRKVRLRSTMTELLSQLFCSRILPFDQNAAETYASLVGKARAGGHILSMADAQIAAIAKTHGYTVATRDASPFTLAGVSIINPWKEV